MTTTPIEATSLTLQQFLTFPEEEPSLEFIDGEVSQKVSPRGPHSTIQVELAARLNQVARPGKISRAFTELRATFAGRSVVPDVSLYRWNRVPVDARGRVASDFVEPPDLAVEIVSPEQNSTALFRLCL